MCLSSGFWSSSLEARHRRHCLATPEVPGCWLPDVIRMRGLRDDVVRRLVLHGEHRITSQPRRTRVPVRSTSAAEFTKKVDACSASATCNLGETCVGKHGFPFYEGKAGRILEVCS